MELWYNVKDRLPEEGALVLIYPTMEFARRFGSKWLCHKIGHPEKEPICWTYVKYPNKFVYEWGEPDLVRKIVKEEIAELLDRLPEDINDDDKLYDDLELDNLDMFNLDMNLQKAFNFVIPNSFLIDITGVMTVKYLIDYIEKITNYGKRIEQLGLEECSE